MRPNLRLLKLVFLLPFVLFLANCNSPSTAINSPGTALNEPSQFTASARADANSAEYVIAPQDVLQVTVFQVPDLSKSTQVNGNGDVTLPLIGQVHVGGRTVERAQQEIAERLGKKYIQSPQVTVLVTKSGQRVTVNGAVKSPSVLTIDGKLTLSQAIAQTGGLSELANSSRIHVARVADEQVKDVVFNLDEIQSGAAADPTLRGGDIVIAEDSNTRVALKNIKDLLPFAVIAALL
jgi:polysaccharide export outer membrane protein